MLEEYIIVDCNGIEVISSNYLNLKSYKRIKTFLNRLNLNGEFKPYSLIKRKYK